MSRLANSRTIGEYAEVLTSPEWSAAKTAAFDELSDDEYDAARRETTIALSEIVPQAMGRRAVDRGLLAWEMHRQKTLRMIRDPDEPRNPIIDAYARELAANDHTGRTDKDLDSGQPEVVRTNSRIANSRNIYDDPLKFFDNALHTINQRKNQDTRYIGPENYATALKFFSDIYIESGVESINIATAKQYVTECMQGFMHVAQKDAPNFIELTNIHAAINELPTELFDPELVPQLFRHDLEQLPDFHPDVMKVIMRSLSKLDLSQTREVGGDLIFLMLKNGYTFEKSTDFRSVVRAVANLPKSRSAEQALQAFFDHRNDLEEVLDIEGLDEMNARLYHIVESVIDNAELSVLVKNMAKGNTQKAIYLFAQKKRQGHLTKSQEETMRQVVQRITDNFLRM